MFQFLKNMWIMKRISAEQLTGFMGKYLSESETEEILSAHQAVQLPE